MMTQPATQRIYLDNGATSWPKPPEVVTAISDFYSQHGSAAARGVASDATHSDRSISRVRSQLANLIGADDTKRVIFTFNGTDSLNMAINGVLQPGDHVVTTVLEHNSVLRPLRQLELTGKIRLSVTGIDSDGRIDMEQLADSIRNDTRLICVSHVSNVLGTVQPVAEIAKIERPSRCLLLVDAAQSIGHLPIDVNEMGCDLLAASGHKGLLGPLGTGLLYLSPKAAEDVEPFRLGGTGSHSENETQPHELPDRLESGNLNVGGILGLEQGVRYINNRSIAAIAEHVDKLCRRMIDGLKDLDAVRFYPPEPTNDSSARTLVSFTVDAMECTEVASILDSEFGIQVRAGLHCAPLVHAAIGSLDSGGTVRVSPGCFSTIDDVDAIVNALKEILNS